MPKIILLIILGLVAVLGGVFYFLNQNQHATPEITVTEISQPWIEVVSPGVFELKPDKSKIRELKTGDELSVGNIIEVGENARANIYFPDGSVARLEPGTNLVISEASFDSKSEKLTVKIKLSVGKVWSKIINLATPDSLWEVKTSNTVATVRGTAFGSGAFKEKSYIFGVENAVEVAAIDPKTETVIKGTETVISPDKFFEIRNEDIPAIKKNPKLAVVKDIPLEITKEDFFQLNKEADRKINEKINELEKSGLQGKELRQAFREWVIEGFKAEIKERRIEGEQLQKIQTSTETQLKTPETQNQTENVPKTSPLISQPIKKPLSLAIVSKNSLSRVIEGDIIQFEAIATMSDNSKINVTATAKWQVLGKMGKMEKPGVFIAELAPEVAESGESSGAVVATWQDLASGEAVLGQSPIFKVEAKFIEIINPEAG